MRRLFDPMRREEGFTLIELLIVIIILGILVAIVIFGVSTFRKNAAEAACNTDEKQVKTAAAAYLAKNNSVAANMNALGPAPGDKLLEEVPPDAAADSGAYYISYTVAGSEYAVVGKHDDGTNC